MTHTFRRLTAITAAVALLGGMALEPAFAQVTPGGPTVGPAGGVASTTAPSNSAGTPAGGTGVISTTRVGPSGAVTPAPTQNTTPMATPNSASPQPRRVAARPRPRPRPRTRPATEVGTQSQAGTNGAVAPSR